MSQNYDSLKLKNQLCFPLYAASREVIKHYRPYLEKIGLTYTQYITMMVLWEEKRIGARDLGQRLFLDSGTLTPVLKSLERKGLLRRRRSEEDERMLMIELTEAGRALQERAVEVPQQMAACLRLTQEEIMTLYGLLYKLLAQFEDEK